MTAGVVALTAAAGLAIQFHATFDQSGSVGGTLWVLARYFTIWTNAAVALAFAGVALGARVTARRIGGVTMAILLVGVVYGLLLRGLMSLSGGAVLADLLLHKLVPVLAVLWWIACAPKGKLRRSDPLWWAVFPGAYLPYALLRGAMEGTYAYPFINVARLGIGQVLLNALTIAAGFLIAGYALLWMDRLLGRGVRRG
ncbi:Pr6Pr family membrane protein [Sphingobium sp. Sx8-8]|uniref:Pr6Pr family membrane protein n=1 Tax=Sphingobium sp. Sx8-8 TaxID=2933617 RepID=UPI001F572179|nr:Pr6Pr family membrane protein [Sphingobium sp. Sx8-8]